MSDVSEQMNRVTDSGAKALQTARELLKMLDDPHRTPERDVEMIAYLLKGLPSDEMRLTAIECICRFCGTVLKDGDCCYCTYDE